MVLGLIWLYFKNNANFILLFFFNIGYLTKLLQLGSNLVH